MSSDSAFLIGARHEICQDYAVAGGRAEGAYVIVSDGCSSSPDTDTGARLLVKAAERLFTSSPRFSAARLREIHEEAARRALEQAGMIGLSPQAVDATLLTAHLSGEMATVAVYGDGLAVFQTLDGRWDVYSVSYPSGYPLYPAYVHQPARLRLFEGAAAKEVEHFRCDGDGRAFRLLETFTSDARAEIFSARTPELKLAAVLSDGIRSFYAPQQTETTKSAGAVPVCEALAALLSFKTMHGAFAARRAKRFKSDCLLKGWRHLDDLAFGVVHTGD